jgi:hypothetical protein
MKERGNFAPNSCRERFQTVPYELRTPNFLLRRGTSDIFWWSECGNLFRKTMVQREYLFYYRQQDHERERNTMPVP